MKAKRAIEAVQFRVDAKVLPVRIDGQHLTRNDVVKVARNRQPVILTEAAQANILRAYDAVRMKAAENKPVYGITTGFGKLANVAISPEQSKELQKNLIMSHACGVGKPFSEEVVRAIMLLRANALANGFSGVSPCVVQTLVDMLNKGVHPVVPEKGSLGASGDLANLAHIALVMIGMGEADFEGERMTGAAAMAAAGITPIVLEGKDGLGLINGTQIMTGLGTLHLSDAINLYRTANIAAALTLEALHGLTDAFDSRIHALRPHPGQVSCAAEMLQLVSGSKWVNTSDRVQDAYTLRCIPQVHGATLDTLLHAERVLDIEMNAVTDNPIVFPDTGDVLSGGNFHGQPLAFALDFLAIAMSELANISERRIERLVNPQLSGLPAFLARQSGINSGYMIAQYTAAALVSENKLFASPASVDSIPSSANQEDHVSMGATSARKAGTILENLQTVLAIELLCAAQAIDLQLQIKRDGDMDGNIRVDTVLNEQTCFESSDRLDASPDKCEFTAINLGKGTRAVHNIIRSMVPTLEQDRVLSPEIQQMSAFVKSGKLVALVEKALKRKEV